ncbi:MAG: CRISPR-associated endonuclease Cas1 [Sphingorhabdus sp.]
MLLEQQITANSHCDDWAIQSENWIAETAKLQIPRRVRERNSNALILTGHGVSMRVENGTLAIRDGYSFYPQKQNHYRYFKGDLELPFVILLLDGSGSLSFDVLSWLSEQNVALARIKSSGEVAVVASPTGYIADRNNVLWQIETAQNHIERLRYSIDLIKAKFANCIETLEIAFQPSERIQKTIGKLDKAIAELALNPPVDLKQLRGIEATCASSYFGIWSGYALQWKTNSRYPIHPHWLKYVGRPSQANGLKPKNVNASHPINAMLNYAYAVKQTQLQIAAIADGFDPTIGIMHNGRRGLPAFIFDQIEPQRPLVDRAILEFMQCQIFTGADFILRKDGVCRLSPQLARMVATLISQ